MGKTGGPRHGSMQFWPRKRAKRAYARVRSWPESKEPKALGFAGYKVGMAHAIVMDNRSTIKKKGELSYPVTILECPPLKVASVRFYKNSIAGSSVVTDIHSEKLNKELKKKISLPKTVKGKLDAVNDYDYITLVTYTQPKLTGIGKKKPEIFEIAIGGSKEEQINYAKEKLNGEIKLSEIYSAGNQIDIHSVTKGKGTAGPIKRFGIAMTSHKAEKARRNPGSLGGWKGQAHIMYRVAHAGQEGFHQRTEYNKQILKISENPEEIVKSSGFPRYGNVKNDYIIIKGSIGGTVKRIIRFTIPSRANRLTTKDAPQILNLVL